MFSSVHYDATLCKEQRPPGGHLGGGGASGRSCQQEEDARQIIIGSGRQNICSDDIPAVSLEVEQLAPPPRSRLDSKAGKRQPSELEQSRKRPNHFVQCLQSYSNKGPNRMRFR